MRAACWIVPCALAAFQLSSNRAAARIGESFQEFKMKMSGSYHCTRETKQEDRAYYRFTLNKDAAMQTRAPGFGIGQTVTVVDGRIVGQSMICCLGEDYDAGRSLTVTACREFTHETLGKGNPASLESAEQEDNALSDAISNALGGTVQIIRYPGFTTKIIMKSNSEGNLLVAAIPDFDTGQLPRAPAGGGAGGKAVQSGTTH